MDAGTDQPAPVAPTTPLPSAPSPDTEKYRRTFEALTKNQTSLVPKSLEDALKRMKRCANMAVVHAIIVGVASFLLLDAFAAVQALAIAVSAILCYQRKQTGFKLLAIVWILSLLLDLLTGNTAPSLLNLALSYFYCAGIVASQYVYAGKRAGAF